MATDSTTGPLGKRAQFGLYNAFPSPIWGQDFYWLQKQTAIGSAFTIGQFGNVQSQTLPPGEWLILAQCDLAALGSETAATHAISINSGNTTTDHVQGINQMSFGGVAAAISSQHMHYKLMITVASGATTVYQKVSLAGAVGNSLTASMFCIMMKLASDAVVA